MINNLKTSSPTPHATKKLCPKFFNDFFTVAKKLFQKLKRNLFYKYEKLKDKWIKITWLIFSSSFKLSEKGSQIN